MKGYAPVSALAHPLNAACPGCGCALWWLHTERGCLTLRRGATQMRTNRCGCLLTVAEVTR